MRTGGILRGADSASISPIGNEPCFRTRAVIDGVAKRRLAAARPEWAGEVLSRPLTVAESITAKMASPRMLFVQGLLRFIERCEFASMNGEAASRASLDLPGIQGQMLEAVVATGKPVVLVLEGGRPLDIRWASQHVPAILEAWYPGTEGGDAVADVLFGDVNPGGKLPVSWPRTAGSEPLYYNHTRTHDPEDAPRFTLRYWDINSKPLYPFGYGLSYSTFKFANLQLSKSSMRVGDSTEVKVEVTNTGAVAGDAVVQIYIHQRYGIASRPVRHLKGFERIAVQPGGTRHSHSRWGRTK